MGGLLAAGQPDYAVGCAWNFGCSAGRAGQQAGRGTGPDRRGLVSLGCLVAGIGLIHVRLVVELLGQPD